MSCPLAREQHQLSARWYHDHGRLALWAPETLGCVVHVPGHWVALTRPEGAQTEQAAAFLCDSLYRHPYALSAEEVGEFFAVIAARQQGGDLNQAGEWSVNVLVGTLFVFMRTIAMNSLLLFSWAHFS